MDLIKDKSDWAIYEDRISNKFQSVMDAKIKGTPQEFPCYVESSYRTDSNGLTVTNYFFYKSHAEKLLNV